MLQFIVVGLVLGSIYALAASGLVITYVSTGVLNFAFGSLAFFIARTYYYLHVGEGVGHPRVGRDVPAGAGAGDGPVPLPGDLPVPPALVAADQGGRHHRCVGGHPGAGGDDLRQRGDLPGARSRVAAGERLPRVRHRGDARPGHRLRLRPRHRGHRRADPALHRGGPERPGDGRLRGHDLAVGEQPLPHRRRRVGGLDVPRRARRASSPPRSSVSTRGSSRCSSRPRSPPSSRPGCAACPSR